ncbi:MAG TPA: cupredoxin domain-containing protein [Candidatus Limnocylindrales bacterium]
MHRRAFALFLFVFAVLAAPVSAHDSVAGTPDATITLRNGLSDREISVPTSGIVRFVNRDDERHRLRSRTGDGFDTGNLEPGGSAQVRLTTAGTYTYIDERDDDNVRYHGRIVVGEAEAEAAAGVVDGSATVTIGDRVFQPGTTTITVGGTVTFRNEDSDLHTATGGIIDSGTLDPGATYKKSFPNAGTYDFLCVFHPDMQGTIRVIDAKAAAPAPTATPTPTPAPATPTPAAPTGDAVSIVDLAFEPATLTVEPGTTVTWTNSGVAPHTATAEDGSFDSGTLASGATFEHTFSDPGTYAYLCQIHPDMTGTIEVTATGPAPAAVVDPSTSPAATAAPPAAVAAVEAEPAADTASLGGIALAVTLVSIASALFARVLRGTVRTSSD